MKLQTDGPALTRRSFFNAAGKYTIGSFAAFALTRQFPSRDLFAVTRQSDSATAKLARFIVETKFDAIPLGALKTAKAAILDCLGVAVAGASEEGARISGMLAREERAKEEATIYGQHFRSSALQAAFVNGIASHAHDFDHSFVAGGQPTSPVIPSVFALGESLGSSGRQILEAYAAGFEVAASLIFSVQTAGTVGWHPNGTIGAFGAAAACAKLLGLKQSEVEMMLGMAASMAGGVTANFGTMTKPLHVGLASRTGVLAARMAKAGFTSNPQTLEARNGFYDSFYRSGKPDLAPFDDLGRVYALEKYGVRFKPYPCGGLTHTAIYATIRLRNEQGVRPEMIEHIDVEVPEDTAAPLIYRIPKSALEGKFSMPYLIARALIDGKIMLDTFTDEAVRNPGVLQLLETIEMKVDRSLQSGTDGSRPSRVIMRLKNGRTQTLHETFPKGSPQVPMTPEELRAKFEACTRPVIGEASARRIMEYVDRLESLTNIRSVTRML
jgi:2-methylcitrate dehydratase PrpD